MIKKLLVVVAGAGLISLACFSALHALGGFPHRLDRGTWTDGGWGGPWRHASRDLGTEATRNLPFAGSDRLEIAFPAEVTYTQGDQPRFTVIGPQGLLDQLTLENGVLRSPNHGRRRWGDGGWGGRLRIDIVSPRTHEFRFAGANRFSLKNYDQDRLEIHSAGAADIDGQGKTAHLDVRFAGAGHLDLSQMTVQDAVVTIAGAGDASLDVRQSAEVSISGAGHVRLKCRPPSLSSHIAGFGSVDAPSCASPAPGAPKSET